MRRIVLVLVILALATSGCEPRGASVRLDPASVASKVAERTARVIEQPAMSGRLDALLAAVAADPIVRERGASLVSSITSDPATAQEIARLIATLQRTPELERTVRELMSAHPGASSEQIGALATTRVETTWASPPINQAWMRAWDRLRVKLTLGPIPTTLRTGIGDRFEAYLSTKTERWGERLIELNGGKLPSPSRATDLYVDRAWSEARLARFLRGVLDNPRVRQELIAATQRLLKLDAVQQGLRTASRALLSDATVQQASAELILLLMKEAAPVQQVERALDHLLQTPVVAHAINQLMANLLAQPEVQRILMEAFSRLAADPQLESAVNQLIDGW